MVDIYRNIEAEIPRLRRYARALARDVAAADDLVQDCLTRALGKIHLWQEGTDLRAWLFTILHNQYVNQVLSRDRLLDLARNREAGPFDRTIDVQVGRLRRKLEDDPQNPSLIKTVRGSGYIFTPTVEFS